MRKPSLAIDFDGVIAETLSPKSAWIARHLGVNIAPDDCSKSRCEPLIGAESYRRMSRALGYADTLECSPMEGAKEGIERLAEDFSICVYTARPEEKAHWAREWFNHWELADWIEGVTCTYGRSKAELAVMNNVSALVDNDIRHLREATPVTTRRIHFSPSGKVDDRVNGMMIVRCWEELVDTLSLHRRNVA